MNFSRLKKYNYVIFSFDFPLDENRYEAKTNTVM